MQTGSLIPPPEVGGEAEVVASLIVNDLTADRLVYADSTKKLSRVANLASWVAGTSNQVTVTNDGDGSITLSLPQSIAASSSPTFAGLTLSGLTPTHVLYAGTGGLVSGDAGLTYNATSRLMTLSGSRSPSANADAYALFVQPTIVEAASGTHALLAGAYFAAPIITAGAAAVTDAATVFIYGAPSASGASNRALYVYSGNSVIRDHCAFGVITTPDQNVPLHAVGTNSSIQIALERTGSSAGLMYIGADSSGLRIYDSGFNARMSVATATGTILWDTNNVADVGSAANGPRTVYAGTSFLGPAGSVTVPSYSIVGRTGDGMYSVADGALGFTAGSAFIATIRGIATTGIYLRSTVGFGWVPSTDPTATPDVILVRDAAAVLALKNGTSPQDLRVYGTTAGAVYLRVFHDATQGGLNTTAGSLYLGSAGTYVTWSGTALTVPGHLIFTDNTYDIGASGATRPRSIYAGTSFVGPVGTAGGTSFNFGAVGTGLFCASANADVSVAIAGTRHFAVQANNIQILSDTAKIYFGVGSDTLLTRGEAGCLRHDSSRTITGAVTDGYTSALRLSPTYSAATAQTVTRHNYIDLEDAVLSGAGPAALTDACVFRLNAALGTHKVTTALDKTANAKDGTLKVNVNGTIKHIQLYAN